MYRDNEELITTDTIGKKDTDFYIEKGSTVIFVKVIDTKDLTKSFVVISYNGKNYTLPEIYVSKKNKKENLHYLNTFNKNLVKNNPSLGVYHPNIFIKVYYLVVIFLNKRVSKLKTLLSIKTNDNVDLKRVKDVLKVDDVDVR